MGQRPQAEKPAPVTYATRRPELDVMRALVVAGLVVFHSAMVFASGSSWFINDPRPSPWFTVFLLWGSLWGMPLLFVVSGMGARYALRSRSTGAFLRERLGRLLVPLLTGLVLLVAPMFYLNRVGEPGFHEPYWRFWLRFLNPAAIATGIPARGTWRSGGDEFDPAHLWFLFSLLVFSIVLVPAFVSLRRPRGARLIDRLAGLTQRHPTSALLVAAVPVMAVEASFGPDRNTGGWERLAYISPGQANGVIMRRRHSESSGDQRSGPRPVAVAGGDADTPAAQREAHSPSGDDAGPRRWPSRHG